MVYFLYNMTADLVGLYTSTFATHLLNLTSIRGKEKFVANLELLISAVLFLRKFGSFPLIWTMLLLPG